MMTTGATAQGEPSPGLREMILRGQQGDAFARTKMNSPQAARRGTDRAWQKDAGGLLKYNHRIYVPDDPALRQEILYDNHDSKMAGHFGVKRTLDLI